MVNGAPEEVPSAVVRVTVAVCCRDHLSRYRRCNRGAG